MLSPSTIDIVKSTAPLIAQTGPALTAHFYQRMFDRHPELKDIFNMTHQQTGAQREALFNAICGYANNIDNLEALLPAVEKIAQKHASFVITPEMYNVVGENLLATIDELFSPGDEVLEAWGEAYGVLANVFIQREEAIYRESESSTGGWRGTRTFKVLSKTRESDVITSFVFAPADGGEVAPFKPGQYIGIHINADEFENKEIRQYSLSAASNGETYRISVKREGEGKVSRYLHNHLQEGDEIELTPPNGDFWLDVQADTPVCLISAGVGLTPMLSMLETLNGNHNAPVYWLHAAENGNHHAFRNRIDALNKEWELLTTRTWYRQPLSTDIAGEHFDREGLMEISEVNGLTTDSNVVYHLCGPVGFMQFAAKQLVEAGVNQDRIKYECFGPHKVL